MPQDFSKALYYQTLLATPARRFYVHKDVLKAYSCNLVAWAWACITVTGFAVTYEKLPQDCPKTFYYQTLLATPARRFLCTYRYFQSISLRPCCTDLGLDYCPRICCYIQKVVALRAFRCSLLLTHTSGEAFIKDTKVV